MGPVSVGRGGGRVQIREGKCKRMTMKKHHWNAPLTSVVGEGKKKEKEKKKENKKRKKKKKKKMEKIWRKERRRCCIPRFDDRIVSWKIVGSVNFSSRRTIFVVGFKVFPRVCFFFSSVHLDDFFVWWEGIGWTCGLLWIHGRMNFEKIVTVPIWMVERRVKKRLNVSIELNYTRSSVWLRVLSV